MAGTPLRILQIYPKGDFFTGAAIQLWELARGLADRGHRVVIATPPSEIWATRCAEVGLTHVAIAMRRAWDPRAAWRLARLIRGGRIQIAHAHKGRGRTLTLPARPRGARAVVGPEGARRGAARLARLIRGERIQIAHAHKGRARTLTLLARLMGARALLVLNRGVSFPVGGVRRIGYTSGYIHAIVAVCESIKRGLVRAGVPADKISVIYSGTDLERFHPGADGGAIRREVGRGPG